jgi:hypothetical protein
MMVQMTTCSTITLRPMSTTIDIMRPMSKSKLPLEQREFLKVKRFIQKRFPGAYTIQKTDGSYAVVDGNGKSLVDPELMLPPAKTVRKAWEYAKYTNWFTNMIRKSNNAFDDNKIYDKMSKKDRSNW